MNITDNLCTVTDQLETFYWFKYSNYKYIWTGLGWPWIETGGGHLWVRWWAFGFREMRGIFVTGCKPVSCSRRTVHHGVSNYKYKRYIVKHNSMIFFTFVPCILILSKFYLFTHQLMHQWVVLKNSIKIYIKNSSNMFLCYRYTHHHRMHYFVLN